MTLCNILKHDGGLQATQRMSVEEQVARFLHIVGNDMRNRLASWIYRRSRSTTSRCFHRVLRAILSLESHYLQQPKGDVVPKEIQEKKRFYPFFKDCVGAIDGTHVRVKVPNKDAARYRGRKGYPTINVLAACTFDLKFTYVLTGWEGTASDSRIIKDAFSRSDKLVIPTGKYYLVDAGLPHTSSLMTPYRGVRYHLKEYSTRAPENSKELFNLRHASLRNAIERAFGVLKKRFPIIRSTAEPFYSCQTQSGIFLACCILHNFLLEEDRDKDLEDEVLNELSTTLEMTFTKAHLKNRLKTLKNRFSAWYDMFQGTSLSGFSWNPETQLIEAEDEVWQKLIDSKPKAAALKTKKVTNYDEMLQLFAKDRASGAQAETAKERNARLQKDDGINTDTPTELDEFLVANDVTLESQYNLDDDVHVVDLTSSLPGQSSSAKKYKSRKRKVEQVDDDLTSRIMNGVGSIANAIAEGNKIIHESNKILERVHHESNKILERVHHREYTGDEIIKELEPMGLEPQEIPLAFNYLVENQAKARSLFSCSSNMRLTLLRGMMGLGN
ncbi:uncharacterized protein LOC110932156 [Helianthus annuus]|uniref:uncharacterized protein LOC110932156 n=1 Tax=Helianthus annuus TaxID=4232 RepID=UPI00165317F9|nr:uncharacterized protein LOC110932156 [Helianthus annuus]